VFSYTGTIQALQSDGSAFPTGVVQIGTTSPADWEGGGSIQVEVPAPGNPALTLYMSNGAGPNFNFTPTYAYNFTPDQYPNLTTWFAGYQQDNAGASTIGCSFPMNGMNEVFNQTCSAVESTTLQFVNSFKFFVNYTSAPQPINFAINFSVQQTSFSNPVATWPESLALQIVAATAVQAT